MPEAQPGSDANDVSDISDEKQILASSAVMAAGTIVSRMSGFVRSSLLAAALGASLHADLFTIANTIPNMLYILLAGGVFNAVLVPQLVRAMKNDSDGGEAYTNRVITLAALFLGAVTLLLVLAAPWVMRVFLDAQFSDPDRAAQLESIIDFTRFCLPQVFFYGMFVLVGQILNARGKFGPMMWAPIANNVISVATLIIYLFAFGAAQGAEKTGAYSGGQEALLGIGSTLGIVAQFLILLPYVKAAGFTYRPRFDFRNTGLGHTLRLGTWTFLFVIVNQIANTIVVRLGSSGTIDGGEGTGYTIYSSAFLIMMVPHSIITVSLATAILPRLSAYAAGGDFATLSRTLASTLRQALVVALPVAALLPVIAPELSRVIWGYGAAADAAGRYAPTLGLFGLGLVFFTFHYLMLRGFYALEQTRSVFFIQCGVAVTNIAVAITLVTTTDAAHTAPSLALSYAASYAVGAALSYGILRHRLAGLETPRLARFVVRMALALAISTGAAVGAAWLLDQWQSEPGVAVAVLQAFLITLVDAVLFLVLARALRLREVTSILDLVASRLPGRATTRS